MNEKHLKSLLAQGRFKDINGQILRSLNVLDMDECTLDNLCIIMSDVPTSEFKNSLHYLVEAGYLRINHKDGAACIESGPMDVPIGVSLTSTGMELLMGIIDNPAVEV